MNTEQAIIEFENIIKMADETGVEPPPEIEAALSALRAQQEQENPQPCEYCRAEPFPKFLMDGSEESIRGAE